MKMSHEVVHIVLLVLLSCWQVVAQTFPCTDCRYAARGGFQVGVAELQLPDGSALSAPVLANASTILYAYDPVFDGWRSGWFSTETRPIFEGGIENENWRVTPIFDEPVVNDYRDVEHSLGAPEAFAYGEVQFRIEDLHDETDIRTLTFSDDPLAAWIVDVRSAVTRRDSIEMFSLRYTSSPTGAESVELLPGENGENFVLRLGQVGDIFATFIPSFPGDATNDGSVLLDDFLSLSTNFGATGKPAWEQGNFDHDDDVDFADFLMMSKNFGSQICGGPPRIVELCNYPTANKTLVTSLPAVAARSASVPEPSSLALLSLCFLGAFCRRR